MNDIELKKKSEAYFDSIAKDNKTIPEPEKCYDIICSRLSKYSGSLLDVGCGEGGMLLSIIRNHQNRFVLNGVDLSNTAIEKAQLKLGEKVKLQKGDVENLPFQDNTFDIVLCMHSFHHYPNPQKAISEMSRVISPGGVLFLVENHRNPFIRLIKNLYYTIMNHPNGDIRLYKMETIADYMKKENMLDISSEIITKKSFLVSAKKITL